MYHSQMGPTTFISLQLVHCTIVHACPFCIFVLIHFVFELILISHTQVTRCMLILVIDTEVSLNVSILCNISSHPAKQRTTSP